jgi:hypothetical protein
VRAAVRVALRELGHEKLVVPTEAAVEHDTRGAPVLRIRGALVSSLPPVMLSLAHDGDDAVAALVVPVETA